MPEICRFFGIVIAMYHKDHLPPHFHAKYGEYRASFSIQDLKIIEGGCPAGRYPSSWNGRFSTATIS